MTATIPGWSPEIERGFKEILFRFLEEIQCTRAALYLFGPENLFVMATQYGFGRRDVLATEHGLESAMVKQVRQLNGVPAAFGRKDDLGSLAEYLASAGNTKLLLVPLIAGDKIIGFIDARDKGRKRMFERTDVDQSKKIAAAMVEYGRHSGFLGSADETDGTKRPRPSWPQPAARPSRGSARAPMLDEEGLETVHDAALDCVLEQQVVGVAMTLVTPEGAATLINLREGGAEVDCGALLRHQAAALAEAGVPPPDEESWRTEIRRIPSAAAVAPSPMISSAVLLNDSDAGCLSASVISGAGAAGARNTLARLRARAEDAHASTLLRFSRRSLARRLLQPGTRAYPQLVAHCEAVSRLAFSMARQLDLSPERVEAAVLVGILHDVGMRELDYERLYNSSAPSADDRIRYQKHPEIGAQILRDTGLDEVASAVRHHHERWDGTGYPDRLAQEEIPYLARLVHVAEVFDVLTVPGRYRPTVSPARAMEIIERGKGHQFDPEMVEVLARVVR